MTHERKEKQTREKVKEERTEKMKERDWYKERGSKVEVTILQ